MTDTTTQVTGHPTRTVPVLRETITVGPIGITFCNTNSAMKLKGHCHTAGVWVTYATTGAFGYPSFKATNDALRAKVYELTAKPFRDCTNEDVTRALFWGLYEFRSPEWDDWAGTYELATVRLDVIGVEDTIGHDPGVTTYTAGVTT